MSPTLVIILIIVVWLIVLAPLLLRGQRPIHQAGEAFDETRVLYEGGSGTLRSRRQPRLRATDVRRFDHEDYEVVEAEAADPSEDDVLIDEPGHVIDGEVIADSTGSTAASALLELQATTVPADGPGTGELEAIDDSAAAEQARGGTYDADETYAGPADLLHPAAREDAAARYRGIAEDEAESVAEAEPEDLSDDEVEFARRRSTRGGWDPDRTAKRSSDLYARRRRTLMGLAIAVLVTLALGIVVGGWMWLAPLIAVGLSAAYLSALRTQVRQERELRAVRIRHLRRARLGVRQSGVPANLRHPGGVVLAIDDASPDFDDLAVTDHYAAPSEDDEISAQRRPFRRVS